MSKDSQTMLSALIQSLQQDTLNTRELQQVQSAVEQAIVRRRQQEEEARRQALARKNRQEFINRVIDFGLRQRLGLSVEQLQEVGEYLYDTEVLGKTSAEIVLQALKGQTYDRHRHLG